MTDSYAVSGHVSCRLAASAITGSLYSTKIYRMLSWQHLLIGLELQVQETLNIVETLVSVKSIYRFCS